MVCLETTENRFSFRSVFIYKFGLALIINYLELSFPKRLLKVISDSVSDPTCIPVDHSKYLLSLAEEYFNILILWCYFFFQGSASLK